VQPDVDDSRSATSAALRSGRTLKPMMIALDAEASSTSDSLMAPTPLWMIRIFTFSSRQLGQRVAEHFGRALHVGLDDDRQLLHAAFGDLLLERLEREPAARPPSAFSFAWFWRNMAIWRALAASVSAWNVSPGCGSPPRPSTSTGVAGPPPSSAARGRR
jgi:hypothetical protein